MESAKKSQSSDLKVKQTQIKQNIAVQNVNKDDIKRMLLAT